MLTEKDFETNLTLIGDHMILQSKYFKTETGKSNNNDNENNEGEWLW